MNQLVLTSKRKFKCGSLHWLITDLKNVVPVMARYFYLWMHHPRFSRLLQSVFENPKNIAFVMQSCVWHRMIETKFVKHVPVDDDLCQRFTFTHNDLHIDNVISVPARDPGYHDLTSFSIGGYAERRMLRQLMLRFGELEFPTLMYQEEKDHEIAKTGKPEISLAELELNTFFLNFLSLFVTRV